MYINGIFNGMYILEVRSENQIITKKVMVQ
ncbi:MAG: T9SS type A sorting domain-containing protein [Saprospiraceae bacterium]|uniref:T9SS type A sorting domain-containing protein n=1 Tax=Candidatus Opimibacter skivensis TaxID=2982028 RepID=A0A9D7XQH7_9BACT|nr:T9SS type A sorting domain-containing protein [Candidatus Opimibacter skivensis]